MIKIAISTDYSGYKFNATLLASIARRASKNVFVRCWCRGFLPESFVAEKLTVEFLPTNEPVTGRYPQSSGPSAYDRLLVIRDCLDWDRSLIMDYDQVVFCDLAPLFELDMGDHLLAAHLQGPGVDMDYAMRAWLQRPFPSNWEHVARYPYFLMPPMLNLAEMRRSGTWEKFQAAHEAFGMDEQLSLTAATEGRILPLEAKWNLFPGLHIGGNQVPDGVVHWCGWPKPWHEGAKVWRPELWESERCSWEQLRMGLWDKPLAVEVEPDDDYGVEELLKRGWKVRLLTTEPENVALKYPDLEIGRLDEMPNVSAARLERVRFGPSVNAAEWLVRLQQQPEHVILRGPVDVDVVRRVVALGYREVFPLRHPEWPAGGPMPRALVHSPVNEIRRLNAAEEWYLRKSGAAEMPHPEARITVNLSNRGVEKVMKRKVAVIVAAVGENQRHLLLLVDSVRKKFLPDEEIGFIIFAEDGPLTGDDIRTIRVKAPDDGLENLVRYRWILEAEKTLTDFDFLVLMKPQVRVTERILSEEILGAGCFACQHSAYEGEARDKVRFEENQASVAWVAPGEGLVYACSSLQGGEREAFLRAVRKMEGWIVEDEANEVSPNRGDESYWNRYLIDYPSTRMLGGKYAWRVTTKVPAGGDPKVTVLQGREVKEQKLHRFVRSAMPPKARRMDPVVSGLWIGGELPPVAELCVRAYLAHGFGFRLHAYEAIGNVPQGCEVLDAREILQEDCVFQHATGSYAPFADWFRFRLLHGKGGIWTDLDMVPLRPFEITRCPWFGMESEEQVGTAVMVFEPGHEITRLLALLAEDPAVVMPWDSREKCEAKRSLRSRTPDVRERRRTAEWACAGPPEFTRALRHFDLMKSAAPSSRLFPVRGPKWRCLYDGSEELQSLPLTHAWAVHLWSEMLRRKPRVLERMAADSLVARLMARHGMGELMVRPTEA